MRSSVQVGALTIVAIALFVGMFYWLGRTVFLTPTYQVSAVFRDVQGLMAGSNVTLAGVNVGTVERVRLEGGRSARVTMRIREDVKIPAGSTARIPGGLIFPGDSRVEIVPPAVALEGSVPPGAELPGQSGGGLEAIMPEAEATLRDIHRTVIAVRNLVEDPAVNRNLRSTLANLNLTLERVAGLTRDAQMVLRENQGDINAIVNNAAEATSQMNRALANVNQILDDPRTRGDINATLAAVREASENAAVASRSLERIVSDPQFRENLSKTTANVEQITATGTEIAANTRDLTAQTKEILQDVKAITGEAREVAPEARRLIARANEIAESIPVFRRGGDGPTIGLNLDFMYNTTVDRYRADVYGAFPFSGGGIVAGVYDATESNRIILQYQVSANNRLAYRYGIYASKPGVGLDWAPSRRFSFTADLFDPNDFQFNFRTRFRFGENWGGFVGIDSLFNHNQPVVGVQLFR